MIRSKIRHRAVVCAVRLSRVALLAAVLAATATAARARDLQLFPAPPPAPRYFPSFDWGAGPELHLVDLEHSYPWKSGGSVGLGLETSAPPETGGSQEPPPSTPAAPPAPPETLFTTGTTLWTAAVVLGGALQGGGGLIRYGTESFHFTDEGWFGYDTYAGGADKASHFTVSSGVSRLLFDVYQLEGHTVDQSFWLSFATTLMAGTLVETFDAVTVYGFSLQDLTADVLGTTSGLLIHRNHLQDLIGLRLGPAHAEIPPEAVGSSEESLGRSYSDEIYAADLKLGGLVPRLHGNPGIARYFLMSFVYFTKGFGYDPPLPSRYQEMGFELGIDFSAILKAAGVKETTWWGKGLFAFFNFFRIPFTQVGVYYNFKNHKWYGPGAPYHFY
jgi:hypothetical protein